MSNAVVPVYSHEQRAIASTIKEQWYGDEQLFICFTIRYNEL